MKLGIKPSDLCRVIGGRMLVLNSDEKIDSFITDTRILKKGDIFWGLKGKNFDGNEFVSSAIEKGARGIISSKRLSPSLYSNLDFFIYVRDSLIALHKLAMWHIKRFNLKVVSVSGSNGKTTTKEMIKDVLSLDKPTIYNPGNLNNDFGLALSVLNTQQIHRYGVFEIGSSKVGDVKRLSKIINPDVAVITTIAPEHLEFFKTMENIFKTETEVIENLKKSGVVVVNGDNEYLKRLKSNKKIKIISFGFNADNDLVVRENDGFYSFIYNGKDYKIRLKTNIRHNYLNAAASFIVGLLFGVPFKKIKMALEKFSYVEMRMEIIKRNKSIIILDAYNANPQSMEYALNEISKYKEYSLVLGDMKELGKYSKKYHIDIAKKILLLNTPPSSVFLIGPEMKVAYDFLKDRIKNVKYFKSTEDGLSVLREYIRLNDKVNILIKGSRSMALERVIKEREK